MALFTSAVTKIGVLSTTILGGSLATYVAWDHITLYAVEREVLGKDLIFDVKDPTNSVQEIIIGISESNKDPNKLDSDHSWKCEIIVEGAAEDGSDNSKKDLASKIRNNVPTTLAKDRVWAEHERFEIRKKLVKACSKNRKQDNTLKPSNKVVVGKLKIKKDLTGIYLFENHPELKFILDSSLHKVEREVIEKNLKITATKDTNGKKITLKAETNGTSSITTSESWVCEVTFSPDTTTVDDTFKGKLQNTLPNSETISDDQKINKELLVRECSKSEGKEITTDNKIKGKLVLTKEQNNKYDFKSNSKLNSLLTEITTV